MFADPLFIRAGCTAPEDISLGTLVTETVTFQQMTAELPGNITGGNRQDLLPQDFSLHFTFARSDLTFELQLIICIGVSHEH